MDNLIEIPTITVKDDFKSFLTEGNSRMLFSSKFGTGKTYFLKSFFKSYAEQYDTFHLYPVHYQINSNEDIVELLKYDIIVELFKKDKDIFRKNEINGIKESFLLFYSWLKEKYSTNKFLNSAISVGETTFALYPDPIVSSLGKLGRPLRDLLEIDKEFQEFKKGEKGLIEKYFNEIKSKDISETDYISQILKDKIASQKAGKKSVLILDDLDRIDPEHIFRILNILSAHFEKENENKFGFDLIIIVTDHFNLEHIFYHKHGNETDFSGYIDKFFTIRPYIFDNKKAVINMVDEIVKNIKNNEPNLKTAISERSGYIKTFLSYVLTNAVDNNILNLRALLKATKFQLSELEKGKYDRDSGNSSRGLFNKGIEVAISIFCDKDHFIKGIKIIKEDKTKTKMPFYFDGGLEIMLESFGRKIPENSWETWNKEYSFRRNTQGLGFIDVDKDKKEDFFCDLLIEYVKEGKYLENDYF